MLSRTTSSGSPTSTVLGAAAGTASTSTSTGIASIPSRAKVRSLASMVARVWYSVSGGSCSVFQGTLPEEASRFYRPIGTTGLPPCAQYPTAHSLLHLLLGPVVLDEPAEGELRAGHDDHQRHDRDPDGERPGWDVEFRLPVHALL